MPAKKQPEEIRILRRKISVKKYNDKCYHSKKHKNWLEEYKKKGKRKIVLAKYRKSEKNRLNQVRYQRKRYRTNPLYKLQVCLRNRVKCAMKRNYKTGTAIKLLGCTIEDLKKYLELLFKPGMTWENYGKWHVDHIIPISSFRLNLNSEVKKACHFSNLQPLWAEENQRKSNKIICTNVKSTQNLKQSQKMADSSLKNRETLQAT